MRTDNEFLTAEDAEDAEIRRPDRDLRTIEQLSNKRKTNG
jgi:hypothetical protein